MVALAYYVCKAAFVIYPLLIKKFKKEDKVDDVEDFEDGEGYDPTIEYLQTVLCSFNFLMMSYTYSGKGNLRPVRWMLVL